MSKKLRIDRSFFPWLGMHFLEFWYYYLGAFLSLYLLHTFQSQIPMMAKELGDHLLVQHDSDVSAWPFVGLALAIIVFRTASRLLFFYPARVQQKILRLEILEKIQKSHPSLYKSFSDGQLYQILNEDINRLRGLVGFGLLQIGNVIIAFSVFIPKIREFNSELVIAFLPIVLGVILFSIILINFQRYVKKSLDASGDVQNFLMESYHGKQTIKNFHAEETFLKDFAKFSGTELDLFFKGSFGPTLSIPLIKLSFGISLLWGSYIIFEQGIGATALIFFSGFLFLMMEPIGFLSWIGVIISNSYAGWKRIKKLIFSLAQPYPAQSHKIKLWDGEIELDSYEKKWTVFCGETGVGKSYILLQIADRLMQAQKKISLVAQEPYLYNDTLINNIILGQERSADLEEEVWSLVKIFSLDYLEQSKEKILNLELGENGKKVSGGQAKRIALMRSLISGSDYLLWDDPFSSVDFILEEKIFNELKSKGYFSNKTLIMTTHRISSIQFCDEIYLLEKKGIAEYGPVKELLNKKSKVSKYFEKQMV